MLEAPMATAVASKRRFKRERMCFLLIEVDSAESTEVVVMWCRDVEAVSQPVPAQT
jgi:hypothetical protein